MNKFIPWFIAAAFIFLMIVADSERSRLINLTIVVLLVVAVIVVANNYMRRVP